MSSSLLRFFPCVVLALLMVGSVAQEHHIFSVAKSEVMFFSDAPLERIVAHSESASGILDITERNFVVRIPMRSFVGFNSDLQQEHFYENYVESNTYPNALFEGRIIEACDLSSPKTYQVRAKGRFTLHGVVKERIIACTIVVAPSGIRVTSSFDVPLADYGIRVPRVVQQKLAAIIKVKIDMLFSPAVRK
jgi:YceI-like domain